MKKVIIFLCIISLIGCNKKSDYLKPIDSEKNHESDNQIEQLQNKIMEIEDELSLYKNKYEKLLIAIEKYKIENGTFINKLNPPEWIIGTWEKNGLINNIIRFEKDNLYFDNGYSEIEEGDVERIIIDDSYNDDMGRDAIYYMIFIKNMEHGGFIIRIYDIKNNLLRYRHIQSYSKPFLEIDEYFYHRIN